MNPGELYNPKGLSYGAHVPNWLLRRKELNLCAKLVWGRLYQFCNEEGRAFPKVDTLANELGCSVSGVKKAIAELEAVGLIRVEDHFGTHESSDYYFIWHEWNEEGTKVPQRGTQKRPRGVHRVSAPNTKETPRGPQSSSSPPYEIESAEETHGRESEESGTRASLSSGSSAEGEDIRGRSEEHPDTEGRQSPGTDELEERIRHAREVARTKLAEGSDKKVNAKAAAGEKKLLKQQKKAAALKEAQERGEVEAETQEGSPLGRLERAWREEFRKAFPETPLAARWGMKQFGQAKQVLALYDVAQVEDAIAYLIHNWKTVRAKLLKNSGDATPGVGVLTYFHESLVPNAALWSKYRDVFDRYASYDPNPDVDRPKALRQEYAAACRELEGLGL